MLDWRFDGLSTQKALHKKYQSRSSLCNLCVLCVSVVNEFQVKPNHRDTENAEVAQRNQTFQAMPLQPIGALLTADTPIRTMQLITQIEPAMAEALAGEIRATLCNPTIARTNP